MVVPTSGLRTWKGPGRIRRDAARPVAGMPARAAAPGLADAAGLRHCPSAPATCRSAISSAPRRMAQARSQPALSRSASRSRAASPAHLLRAGTGRAPRPRRHNGGVGGGRDGGRLVRGSARTNDQAAVPPELSAHPIPSGRGAQAPGHPDGDSALAHAHHEQNRTVPGASSEWCRARIDDGSGPARTHDIEPARRRTPMGCWRAGAPETQLL